MKGRDDGVGGPAPGELGSGSGVGMCAARVRMLTGWASGLGQLGFVGLSCIWARFLG